MLADIKDKAKREQLKRLIAMLGERMDDDGRDQDHDDEVYADRLAHEKMEGKRDEYRERHDDEHPEEDLHEDEDSHHKKYEKLRDDVDADEDDHEEDEEYDVRHALKEFLGGHKMPEDLENKKAKAIMMEPGQRVTKTMIEADIGIARPKKKRKKRA